MATLIPEILNHYNVYDDSANKIIGISGEVELPSFEAITDTIDGAGVMGEIEDPATGQFASMKIKIPFAVLYADMFKLCNTTAPMQLTLRGSMQCMDPSTGATDYYPVKVVVRGKATTTELGNVVKGKKMEPSVEMEVLYIKVMINNSTVVELDKLKFVLTLNGVDIVANLRKQV